MLATVDLELTARVTNGISAVELAARGRRRSVYRLESVSATELALWLLDQELAVEQDGLLRPTARGLELGAAIDA